MTSLLDIGSDIIGVILDTSGDIIPLISTLRWAPGDHLFLKLRHGLLASHSSVMLRYGLSSDLDCTTPAEVRPAGPTFCQQLWSYAACLWLVPGFTLKPVGGDGGLSRPPRQVILGTMLRMFPCVSFSGFYRKALVCRQGRACPSMYACQVYPAVGNQSYCTPEQCATSAAFL